MFEGAFLYAVLLLVFFFNDTATTEIYTLSLHDALPISNAPRRRIDGPWKCTVASYRDRKSTRLNSSHVAISYAVFCLKKKKHKRDDAGIEKDNDNDVLLPGRLCQE